jgi:hypothetical protein
MSRRTAFEEMTVLMDGRWTPRDAYLKAEALIRRVKAGKINLDGVKPAEPSYPDDRRPLEEAEAAVQQVVDTFFAEHVPALRQAVQRAKEAGTGELLDFNLTPNPVPISWGARVETAIGKTAVAIRAVAKAVMAGVTVVYAVPTHRLGVRSRDVV